MYPRKYYRFSRVRFFCFWDVKFAIVQPCRFDRYFAVWYHLRVVFFEQPTPPQRKSAKQIWSVLRTVEQTNAESDFACWQGVNLLLRQQIVFGG